MNDEIKFDHFENINELLEHIDLWYEEEDIYYERWFGLNDLKKLKDYITNLQQINKNLTNSLNKKVDEGIKLQLENERLTRSVVSYDETLLKRNNEYEDYKSRNEKAIELLQDRNSNYDDGDFESMKFQNDVIKILQGSDKE